MIELHAYYDELYKVVPPEVIVPEGFKKVFQPNPSCYYKHYSNPDCQNSFVCSTPVFPTSYNPETQRRSAQYSDRMNRCTHDEVSELIGTGDQGWHDYVAKLSDNQMREVGKIAFSLVNLPAHFRCLYSFNVSSGYACPIFEVIYDK